MRRDARLRGALLAIGLTGLFGMAIHLFQGEEARERALDADFHARFQQAAVMLHAKQYGHAATALHSLLAAAPQVPELHVNMGYALLGLQDAAAARDFFQSAIELRPAQANAYYGLAEALRALGDRRGALGAMRAYVHLSPPDDPFARKAQAAIRELENP